MVGYVVLLATDGVCVEDKVAVSHVKLSVPVFGNRFGVELLNSGMNETNS